MSTQNPKAMTIDTIDRQRNYVQTQKEKGGGLGVVFADAFLRGMRDLGYKSPAWALAEQLDNAFQAGASTVSVRFGFEPDNKTQVKPDFVAVSDDGNGMIPEMISYAVRWGGTDREGDRTGFGRYGYGLPSSAVSLGKRYTVFSKIPKQPWHAVTVDIDELAAAANHPEKTDDLLSPRTAKLPTWLIKAEDSMNLAAMESGTVIVLEQLDRFDRLPGWKKADTLKTKLLQHFGVIYRHWIPARRILVEGNPVQAVDPLFLMEHARFYDETPVRAQAVEARSFEVESARGKKGTVTIRASVMSPNFQLVDPSGLGGSKTNKRHEIMRDYNGLLICRERRQIDCISPGWTKFQNYDANIKIEIDFDPELDEFFGITTAKQQIVIEDSMWEKLKHSGKGGGALTDLVMDLRARFKALQTEHEAKTQNVGEMEERPSIQAMEKSEKFKDAIVAPTRTQKEEGQRNIEHVADEVSSVIGKPKQEVLAELVKETSARPWSVEFAAIPEGPFYRPMRLGEQKRVIINTDHPFYTKMYNPSAPEVCGALEVLLFVFAERELESIGDAETFYRAERQKWSERLRHALDQLLPDATMVNKAAAVAERLHFSVEEAAS
jgi:hypothetical protein